MTKFKVLKTNEVIFIGTPQEIERKLGCNAKVIYSAAKHGTYYKGYKFDRVQEIQELFEETKRLLLMYGNTNMRDNPEKIVEMLKADGIEVLVEHYKPIKKKDALGSHGETFKEDWILTLI